MGFFHLSDLLIATTLILNSVCLLATKTVTSSGAKTVKSSGREVVPILIGEQQLEDEVTSKERFLLFCRATEQLSQPVRKCFILKKVYGMSQKEIAEQMCLSESTVEKHIAKGSSLKLPSCDMEHVFPFPNDVYFRQLREGKKRRERLYILSLKIFISARVLKL